jgi:uncharacterized membrane protein
MRRLAGFIGIFLVIACLLIAPQAVEAQTSTPTPVPTAVPVVISAPQGVSISTPYPLLVLGVGEVANLDLTLRSNPSDVVKLQMKEQPQGWTITFRGGGQIVEGAYVEAGLDTSVQMQIEQPQNVAAGDYNFVVQAVGKSGSAELPLTLTVKEKLPPKLTMTTDLPTLKGSPTTTFSYNVTLTNEGEDDLNVTMSADAPNSFQVSFTLTGQDVTSFPLNAHATKSLSVSLKPNSDIPAGSYSAKITAQGGPASATLDLSAEVTGQATLSLSTSDGRLSGQATLGQTTPIQFILSNTGSASASQINLSSNAPAGWKVEFSPAQVAEVPAGQEVQITANITPTDQAVAGDYQVTLTASPADGSSKSVDFRITVVTSTLWGLVGLLLIAVAVGVVAAAVLRFGRR